MKRPASRGDLDWAVRKISPGLGGLSEEDVAWAIRALEEVILPYQLKAVGPDETTREAAEQAVANLYRKLEQLRAGDKKMYLLELRYQAMLEPINIEAYDLAVLRYTGASSRESIEARATDLSNRLALVTEELETAPKELFEVYSGMISESLLDLKYSVTGNERVSQRLFHFISKASPPPAPPAAI